MLLAAFTLTQILSYPFPSAPVRDAKGTAIAYTIDQQGVRSIWFARPAGPQGHAPYWPPAKLFSSGGDDGQELSDLVISNDAAHVVYVRGGDHDENWPVPLQPNPAVSTVEPQEQVWSISTAGGAPKLLGDGDAPAISPDGVRVAFVDGSGAVQVAPIDGSAPAKRLFFDRGRDSDLRWSPDGTALVFVSDRGDHSFIGIYRNGNAALEFLAPATSQDFMPRWSPDGAEIAFIRLPGDGGPPRNSLNWNPLPWQIWVAKPGTSYVQPVWASGDGLRDSLPQSGHGPLLEWLAANRLVFLSEQDNWPHLYSVSASAVWCGHSVRTGPVIAYQVSAPPCRRPRLLTHGSYMVEDVSVAPDLRSVVFSANFGPSPDDRQRRRLFRVDVDGERVIPLTLGNNVTEAEPVALADDGIAFYWTLPTLPPLVAVQAHGAESELDDNLVPRDFPDSNLEIPRSVTFKAPDGTSIDGQLFLPKTGGRHPGIIFVHGGPFRQMLLNWHYMDYYSNAYAVNQYLASRGFVVLSVNYRCGIGYGHDFNFPPRWGPTGAVEYQDVVAGARFLQRDPRVDAKRIGIWGGSYGGYLTALALARNSDIFKAGVDFHGVHDWSLDIENPVWGLTSQLKRYQQYDTRAMMKLAWESSPDSAIATWRSPVLLIQGDDDRNVEFHQMVDLVERLRLAGVAFDQIVIPNEIHGFLRYASWLQADTATVDYFNSTL
ncbi:MAG TPA: prolyl oligopeptidase family serine peptidase [Candidatus Cybelea sp.]|nr:prolyl oligopeptidase family serine peptidase [Candidatus Cybelea sp.]